METPVLGISAPTEKGITEASIVLFEPSEKAYRDATDQISKSGYSETEFLHNMPMLTDLAEDQVHLVEKTSALHLENRNFSAADFLDATGYVHLSDPGLPGPEYDVPRSKLFTAQPTDPDARKAWQQSYEMYRQQRMEVCGLDLEPSEIIPT